MKDFFVNIEERLGCKLNFKTPILRKFFSVEEQNNWFAAADKVNLVPFLSTELIFKKFRCIDSPFGYGEVMHTGHVDTVSLLEKYKEFLLINQAYSEDSFDYNCLKVNEQGVCYKGIQAKHIVFAEGFGMHANPFFNDLPLDGTKGELLIIKAPLLDLDVILNTSVFILPLGNHLYKVGATYNWIDKTATPTNEGKTELVDKIKEIITCDFEIIEHFAGVRPTVRDRRPLVGTHENHDGVHVLNGLGTRGLMLGPAMAKALFELIEHQIPLDKSIDIIRFKNKK
jgi:hypothetical protein